MTDNTDEQKILEYIESLDGSQKLKDLMKQIMFDIQRSCSKSWLEGYNAAIYDLDSGSSLDKLKKRSKSAAVAQQEVSDVV